jgi:hypothetical protein
MPRITTSTAALASLAFAASAFAQSGFDLSWRTVDCGGALSLSGGGFSFSTTTGQPDAGVMSGDGFELAGGFWPGVLPGTPAPTPRSSWCSRGTTPRT